MLPGLNFFQLARGGAIWYTTCMSGYISGEPLIPMVYKIYIKTHDSESRGQEEAGRMRRLSVLFTGSTGVKFVNALNKPPLKL